MSSHREAPEISKDPVADNTDTYAFVSPDKPDTVTIITNYIPLEDPPGGPNFFEFGDDVLYSIYIDNDGDGMPDIEYRFRFKTKLRNPDTFLYNTGQITGINSPNWNRRQFYEVSRVNHPNRHRNGHKGHGPKPQRARAATWPRPPCNIGPRSTPNYQAKLADPAVHKLQSGERVFAGQRNEGFFVDLGSIFDLGDLRPLQNLHLIATSPAMARRRDRDPQRAHDRAPDPDQAPHPRRIGSLEPDGGEGGARHLGRREPPQDPGDRQGERQGRRVGPVGPGLAARATRCSTRSSCRWARRTGGTPCTRLPTRSSLKYVEHPELGKLLPVLYPGVFPNLAALKAKRADLVAILLTGLPKGIIPGFQNNTGKVLADMLRLNVAIPPTTSSPNPLGILGGDLAGFPNGRRVVRRRRQHRAAGDRRAHLPAGRSQLHA